MIWQPPPDVFQFEPGANYPVVGEILYKALQKASKDLESKDPHSAFARELRNREEFIWFIVVDHQHIPDPPYWTWWGDQRGSSPRGDVPVSENGSLTLLNATGLQVENTTSVRFDRLVDVDCTATANGPVGPCSISRRLKRRKKHPV